MEITENQTPCGCGRSPTGFCIGLHEMTQEEYQDYLMTQLPPPCDEPGSEE